jgi:hypothetical protein
MKKENSINQFLIPYIFIMLLFLTIVILSFMMILAGKNIYNNINEDRKSNYDVRVTLSYVANKMRQADRNDGIEIREINGNNALVIRETYDDADYETWIYYYNNSLYEIFTDEGSEFEMIDGNEILKVEDFDILKLKENLFKLTVNSAKNTGELVIALKSYQ